jgi:hypothetical protein
LKQISNLVERSRGGAAAQSARGISRAKNGDFESRKELWRQIFFARFPLFLILHS